MNEEKIPTLKVSTEKNDWMSMRERIPIQFMVTQKMREEASRTREYIDVSSITFLQENKWGEQMTRIDHRWKAEKNGFEYEVN